MDTALWRQMGRVLIVAVPSLALATVVVAFLQDGLGVPNASAVYLVAVVVCALATGTPGAILAAIGSFLAYDFLLVEPRFTFTISDPSEYLSVILLLFIGVVVGQLAALQRSRAVFAHAREREARSLFQVSRELATRESTPAVLPTIALILRNEAAMSRVWFSLGVDDAREHVAADSDKDQPRPGVALHWVLQRMPGDIPARWVRVHRAVGGKDRSARGVDVYRVRIESQASIFGSIWASRPHESGEPNQSQTRLLASAADQVGQVLRQDQLAAEAQAAEIARQSDALKSALLQSVSHDLRTPLATIRAAAGTLRPGTGLSAEEQLESTEAIDREVEYLNRMVTNLLDLSRIEAGVLLAERDAYELDDLVGRTLDRMRARLASRTLEVNLDAPPVDVDAVFLDEAVTNALENAIKYTPVGTRIRITARVASGGTVRLTIEDGGAGVPDAALPRIFDKFYRVPGGPGGSRAGTGIGLAVVKGLVEAMGGQIAARRSDLGGLAIDFDLRAASIPGMATAEA